MRKAVVEEATGKVVNVIEIEKDANWKPPEGCVLMDNGEIGDTWDGIKFIHPELLLPEPPRSTHVSILQAVNPTKARPAKVKRTWQGIDYFYDCLVIQTVKDEYVAGKIKIGDYVLVHFDEMGEQIVTAKVFKSW